MLDDDHRILQSKITLSTRCLNHLCNVGDSDCRDKKWMKSVGGNVVARTGIWNVNGCHVSFETKKMSVCDVRKLKKKICGSRSVIWDVYVSVCQMYRMLHCPSCQILGKMSVPCKFSSSDL